MLLFLLATWSALEMNLWIVASVTLMLLQPEAHAYPNLFHQIQLLHFLFLLGKIDGFARSISPVLLL
jgi:hypothetical protein